MTTVNSVSAVSPRVTQLTPEQISVLKKDKSFVDSAMGFMSDVLKTRSSVYGWTAGTVASTASSVTSGAVVFGIAKLFNIRDQIKNKQFVKETLKPFFAAMGRGIKAIPSLLGKIPELSLGDVVKAPYTAAKALVKGVANSKIGKVGKVLTFAAAGMAFAYGMFKTALNINEKHAQIDHRYRTTHDTRD